MTMETPIRIRQVSIFPTFRCNLCCAFCVGRALPVTLHGEERPVEQWAAFLSNVRTTFLLAITGGEPTVYKDIGALISATAPNLFSIDTNCVIPPWEYLREEDLRRCGWFCASLQFHPLHPRAKTLWESVEWLKERGVPTQVTHVALERDLPEQWDLFKKMVEERGAVAVLGMFDHRFLWRYKPLPRLYGYVKRCDGGKEVLIVAPDGTAFRCVGHLYANYQPLGNVFEQPLEQILLPEPQPCEEPYCTICDTVEREVEEGDACQSPTMQS